MKQSSKRRKRHFIDSEVQGRLVLRIGGQWLLLVIANALGLMIWMYLYEMPEAGLINTLSETCYRYAPFLVVSLALLPVFIWDINRTTNRFAGPIARLRAALSSAAIGQKVEPLTFRDNDFWGALAKDFNQLVDRQVTGPQTKNASRHDDSPLSSVE